MLKPIKRDSKTFYQPNQIRIRENIYFVDFLDFSFLTLGTYGTLREIQFTQELRATRAHFNEYYMGLFALQRQTLSQNLHVAQIVFH